MKSFVWLSSILLLAACATGPTDKPVPDEDDTDSLTTTRKDTIPRVTGIGGIFFKAENPDSIRAWYAQRLGVTTDLYGAVFEFRNARRPDEPNYLRWSPMADTTSYFEPSGKPYMINYRVQHIEALVANLRRDGVTILDSITAFEYGKFVHILDPEGNAIELWEPVDSVLTAMGGETTY